MGRERTGECWQRLEVSQSWGIEAAKCRQSTSAGPKRRQQDALVYVFIAVAKATANEVFAFSADSATGLGE